MFLNLKSALRTWFRRSFRSGLTPLTLCAGLSNDLSDGTSSFKMQKPALEHITLLIKSCHWLAVPYKITLKVAHKALNGWASLQVSDSVCNLRTSLRLSGDVLISFRGCVDSICSKNNVAYLFP